VKHNALPLACALVFASGCYRGTARDAELSTIAKDRAWVRVDVPVVRQRGTSDCGTAALSAVLAYWNRPTTIEAIDQAILRDGAAAAGDLERYARSRGLVAFTFSAQFSDLTHELDEGRPVIVGVAKPFAPGKAHAHYEVVMGYEPVTHEVLTLDPALGPRTNDFRGFMAEWQPTGRVAVVASDTSE